MAEREEVVNNVLKGVTDVLKGVTDVVDRASRLRLKTSLK